MGLMSNAEVIVAADPVPVDVRDYGKGRPPSPFERRAVPVTSILVREGFDQDFSTPYVEMLAAIVRKYGLRDPITITADGRLVAGARWLAVVKELNWDTVEVAIVEDAT
jgi:ParB-like chromosome segregation protein Spo0J